MRLLRKLAAAAFLSAFGALPAQALIWSEIDAGELLGTADVTMGSGVLTQINGHLDFDINAFLWDVDVYRISIDDPGNFTASTVAGTTKVSDPALFLFDASGKGVYMNNDNAAADFQSTLPFGNPNGPGSPGVFYLAIAWGFSLAYDSALTEIFALIDQIIDPTGVYGPDAAADALASWAPTGPVNFDAPADYMINLRGARAAVPEPGTLALLVAAAAGVIARRRRIH